MSSLINDSELDKRMNEIRNQYQQLNTQVQQAQQELLRLDGEFRALSKIKADLKELRKEVKPVIPGGNTQPRKEKAQPDPKEEPKEVK